MHQKRNRTTFNKCQLNVLEHAFKHNNYPTPNIREALATQIRIDPSRIQVWFQNRRAKLKRQVSQTTKRWFVIDAATNAVNLAPSAPQSHANEHHATSQLHHQQQQHHQHHYQHQHPLLNQAAASAAQQLASSMDQCAASIQQQMALDLHLGASTNQNLQQQHQLDNGFLEQAACLYGGSGEQSLNNQKLLDANEDSADQNKEPMHASGQISQANNNGLFYGQNWLAASDSNNNNNQHPFVDDSTMSNQQPQLVIHAPQQDHLTSSASSASSASASSSSPSSSASISPSSHQHNPLLLAQETSNLIEVANQQLAAQQHMIGSTNHIKHSTALRILSQGNQHQNQSLFASIAAAQQQHQSQDSRFCERLNMAVSALASNGNSGSPATGALAPASPESPSVDLTQQQQQINHQQLNISGAQIKLEPFNLQFFNQQQTEQQQQQQQQQQNQNKQLHLQQPQQQTLQQQQYASFNAPANYYKPQIGVLRSVADYLH